MKAGFQSVKRWIRLAVRIMLVLGGIVTLAGIGGWLWDRSEEQAFWDLELEPPGEWVQIGDRRFHVRSRGSGSPGVLFIAGGTDGLDSFSEVQDSVAGEALAVTYDRVGVGWSPPGRGASSIDRAVDDVGRIVSESGLFDGPVILVGHSYGGTIARVAAERYPGLIAGVVLVDAAEAYAIPPEGKRFLKSMELKQAIMGTIGLARWSFYRDNPDLTREEQLVQAHLQGRGGRALRANYVRMREAMDYGPPPSPSGTLGTLPLTVLAANARGARPEPFPEVERMAALSDAGRVVIADTGHYIHWDDPQLVISEVRRMVQQVRGDGGSRRD